MIYITFFPNFLLLSSVHHCLMECAILNREPSKMTLIFFFTDDFLDKLLYDFLNNFLDAVGLDTLGHFQSCLTEQALVALICFLCEIVNERKGKSNLILQILWPNCAMYCNVDLAF